MFIDPVWIDCTHLKDEFLFLRFFTVFCGVRDSLQIVIVVVGVVRKIKMAGNWFGCICVGVHKSGPPIFSLFPL